MYDNGINNEFESAHQNSLRRGFDLGWSYKGRFDRQIIKDHISKIEDYMHDGTTGNDAHEEFRTQIRTLKQVLKEMKDHPNNRENITLNSF